MAHMVSDTIISLTTFLHVTADCWLSHISHKGIEVQEVERLSKSSNISNIIFVNFKFSFQLVKADQRVEKSFRQSFYRDDRKNIFILSLTWCKELSSQVTNVKYRNLAHHWSIHFMSSVTATSLLSATGILLERLWTWVRYSW